MPHEFCFDFPLPHGLHARPASYMVDAAAPFSADITLVNQRCDAQVNAKSILSLVGADVRQGDRCCMRFEGPDAPAAMAAMRRFVQDELPRCDDAQPTTTAETSAVVLPRVLRKVAVAYHPATSVSRGIGRGTVVLMGGLTLPAELSQPAATDVAQEQSRLSKAIAAVHDELEGRLAPRLSKAEAGILKAHLAIVDDVSFRDKLFELASQNRSAGQAVVAAEEFFAARLRAAQSQYLRERVLDVQDICEQLLEALYDGKFQAASLELTGSAVVFSETLTPRQFLLLDRRKLKGLVLRHAGTTSHTIILARSFGIPVLAGLSDAQCRVSPGDEVIVDGDLGIVVTQLTPPVCRYYEQEENKHHRRRARLTAHRGRDAVTADGRRMELAANIASAEEVASAIEQGAEAVGVFRTEMLFMDRDQAPSEEEQFAAYKLAAQSAGGKSVIIRTIDIGGDKPLPYLHLPRETNPFLGYRGVRIYREYQALFDSQMRAILRASAFGAVRAMVPMVTTVEEVRWVRARVAALQAELKAAGIAHDPAMPVGIMIEVPSVAFILDQLAREADFFSIGSNDLAQYALAADRDSPSVANLYHPRHPAFLRFLRQIVDSSHAQGKWIGLCGEMGTDLVNLPLMIGMGLDEVSGSAAAVGTIKSAMARLNSEQCRAVLEAAMQAVSPQEVDEILREFAARAHSQSLLDEELILLDCDSGSKEEAIKQIVDAFYVAGRTDDPRQVEEAVWAREAVYSTGLGQEFAVPHCKTDVITANSIGIARLRDPVDWGAVDARPVRLVFLLATRATEEKGAHLKVFARLARKLVSDRFRERLMAIGDAAGMKAYLAGELEIPDL